MFLGKFLLKYALIIGKAVSLKQYFFVVVFVTRGGL
jgi:hypothetical protein